MFFRIKPAKQYRYLQIAQSVREGGKVRQQVLATLGRLDVLEASGQLERLLRSGLKYCKKIKVLEAQAQGELQPVSIRRIGPSLVFSRLWEDLEIGTILLRLLGARSFDFSVERAVYLTVLHRLFGGGNDRAAEKWGEPYLIPGSEDLSVQNLYRAMRWLGGKQGPTGARYAVAEQIQEELFNQGRDLFSKVDLVFFHITAIYLEGQGGDKLGQPGYSQSHGPDLKQMVVGLGMDVMGQPLFCQMWSGNTADATTLIPIIDALQKRFCVRQMCVVADRGMVNEKTLANLEKAGLPYIVGVRMREQTDVSQEVLPSPQQWVDLMSERKKAQDPSPLRVKEVWVKDRRYVVCLNEEEKRNHAHERDATVKILQTALKQGDKSLIGNERYRRYLKVEGKNHFSLDEAAIKRESLDDGIYLLKTNTNYDAEVVACAHKMLWQVESGFHTAKSILESRPIYHNRDETIRGQVFCSFLGLCLKFELEKRLREKGLDYEWAEVIRGLDALQEVVVELNGEKYLLRSQLTGHASQGLRAAGVAAPPSLREVPHS